MGVAQDHLGIREDAKHERRVLLERDAQVVLAFFLLL
jgi:hypothetical protein